MLDASHPQASSSPPSGTLPATDRVTHLRARCGQLQAFVEQIISATAATPPQAPQTPQAAQRDAVIDQARLAAREQALREYLLMTHQLLEKVTETHQLNRTQLALLDASDKGLAEIESALEQLASADHPILHLASSPSA